MTAKGSAIERDAVTLRNFGRRDGTEIDERV
jgi:hypothetical protein